MIIYSLCLKRLGLSVEAAAALHSVSIDTVKNWSSGRTRPPEKAFDLLRQVEAHFQAIAAGQIQGTGDLAYMGEAIRVLQNRKGLQS
jgi:hypothetical protein